MGAIAGVWFLDGRKDAAAAVGKMISTMPHRSPDGSDVWDGGDVALGHLRLYVTPESRHDPLPRVSSESGTVLTAHVRLDNREDLAKHLSTSASSEVGDGRLMLEAYDRWGAECVDHLIGDYATAIWDERERRLFCFRDHVGAKPFFYVFRPGKLFAFATEIKALLAVDEVKEEIDMVRLARYIAGKAFHDREPTVFKGIKRLPGGHCLTVDADGLRIREYWSIHNVEPDTRRRSDSEYAEELHTLLKEAVRCRMRSDAPVASELSGGLDSSYITCLARDVAKEDGSYPVRSVSLYFDRFEECDERRYINDVIDQGGIEPIMIPGDELRPLAVLDDIYNVLDDAYTGGNHHMMWACHVAAAESGSRVLLDGFDGDVTISHGYDRLGELARAGEWKTFIREAELLIERQTVVNNHLPATSVIGFIQGYALPVLEQYVRERRRIMAARTILAWKEAFGSQPVQLLKRYARRLATPRWMDRNAERGTVDYEVTPLINREFVREYGLEEAFREHDELRQMDSPTVRDVQKATLSSDVFARTQEIAEHYAAACGLEIRHPYMDVRVLEYCVSIPSDQSLSDGWTRHVMRRAMKDTVPASIAWRPDKTDFGAAFQHGLMNLDRSLLESILMRQNKINPILTYDEIQKMWKGGADIDDSTAAKLSQLATLTHWLSRRKRLKDERTSSTGSLVRKV